jgi:hypothetical protein
VVEAGADEDRSCPVDGSRLNGGYGRPRQRVDVRIALGGLEDSGRLHAPDQAVNEVGLDELRDGDAVVGKVAEG